MRHHAVVVSCLLALLTIVCTSDLPPAKWRLQLLLDAYLDSNEDSDRDALWEQFKELFGKQYDDSEEDERRKAIFAENVRKIGVHNELYEEGKSAFRMQLNSFGDMTVDEVVKVYARYPLQEVTNTTKPPWKAENAAPGRDRERGRVDLRETECVTPVKDQFPCGSCWAFVAVTIVEYNYCIQNCGMEIFSEQELIDCSGPYGNNGCDGGGWYHYAWKYMKDKKGLSTAKGYPRGKQHRGCAAGRDKKIITDIETVPIKKNEEAMRIYVKKLRKPIAVGLHLSWMWMFYSDGILDDPLCSTYPISYHGLAIIGYGNDHGTKYWIAKNSWGSGWGEDGFMRIRRNSNQCGLADFPMGLNMKCTDDRTYDCNKNSPCTAANRARGLYYFAYSGDRSHYVQCGISNRQCWLRRCAPGTKWSQMAKTCVV